MFAADVLALVGERKIRSGCLLAPRFRGRNDRSAQFFFLILKDQDGVQRARALAQNAEQQVFAMDLG